jgi:PAS domain S-box-containing protein
MKSRNHRANNKKQAILIVEDSATQAEQLEHLLVERGYKVKSASNGKEALAAIRRFTPVLVISDVVMPEMDGYALCEALKSRKRLKDVPVILLTSLSSAQDVIRGLQSGADNFVRKPYDQKYLLSRIEHILTNRELRKGERVQMGVEIYFGGQRHFISSERQQILDLLISTYEQAVQMNDELAIYNTNLERSSQFLRTLYGIAKTLNKSRSEKDVVEKVTEAALQFPGVRGCWLCLRDGESGLRLVGSACLPPALLEPGAMEGDCHCRRKLLSGELVKSIEILECERLKNAKGDVSGLRHHASIPLWIGDKVLGLLNLATAESDSFTEEDLKNLNGVGNQIGAALERTRLYENLEMLVEERTAKLQEEVTERKRVEEALRESEEKYRSIFENAVEGIYQSTIEGRYLTANPMLARMFGYDSPQELITAVDLERRVYVVPERRSEFIRLIEEQNIVLDFQSQMYRKDGTVIWVSESVRALRDASGKIVTFEGTAMDITKNKLAEEAQERLIAILEATTDLIGVADPQGRLLYLNSAGRRMLEIHEDEHLPAMSNRQILDFHPERVRQSVLEVALPTAIREGSWSDENVLLSRTGREIPVSQVVIAHKAPDGTVEFLSTIARDISEKQKAEVAKALLEDQFRQSQKLESVGQLAGGVAHDFNNILMAVTAYSELLLMKMDPSEPLRQEVAEINRASERGAALTRQLLAFSRKQILCPRILDLNLCIGNIEDMLRRLIGEDVDLVTVFSHDLGSVKADPGQIEQVIVNFGVNARDAMPKGGKLTIETANVELDEAYVSRHAGVEPGRYVMLCVSDTGSGMDEETLRHIFEPFFTTKEEGKGTGLGLSTVYGIVKQSGGNIWVYSHPGQGTTFKVYLPRIDETAKSEMPQIAQADLSGRGETILLVDDNDGVRTALAALLEMKGYSVLQAENGKKALEVLAVHEGRLHLLVTDVVMPEMNGPELAEQVSRLKPGLKKLFMSGYAAEAIIRNGLLEADTAFISKPATMQALLGKIREILGPGES